MDVTFTPHPATTTPPAQPKSSCNANRRAPKACILLHKIAWCILLYRGKQVAVLQSVFTLDLFVSRHQHQIYQT